MFQEEQSDGEVEADAAHKIALGLANNAARLPGAGRDGRGAGAAFGLMKLARHKDPSQPAGPAPDARVLARSTTICQLICAHALRRGSGWKIIPKWTTTGSARILRL